MGAPPRRPEPAAIAGICIESELGNKPSGSTGMPPRPAITKLLALPASRAAQRSASKLLASRYAVGKVTRPVVTSTIGELIVTDPLMPNCDDAFIMLSGDAKK